MNKEQTARKELDNWREQGAQPFKQHQRIGKKEEKPLHREEEKLRERNALLERH